MKTIALNLTQKQIDQLAMTLVRSDPFNQLVFKDPETLTENEASWMDMYKQIAEASRLN